MSSKPLVLIISQLNDPDVDEVIKRLDTLGVSWFRLNTETFPLLSEIDWRCDSSGTPYSLIRHENKELDTRKVTAVWYRSFGPPWLPEGLSELDRKYVDTECRILLYAAIDSVNCKWVNNRNKEFVASYKTHQLNIARKVGLNIPRTLITNDLEQVLDFVDECDWKILFKPLGGPQIVTPVSEEEVLSKFKNSLKRPADLGAAATLPSIVYSQILTEQKIDHLKEIEYCPAIFQEYVEKDVELRITIIGEKMFCCEIHSQDYPETQVDFRRFFTLNSQMPLHRATKIPIDLEEKLLNLMKELDLVFGGVDVIKTPDNEYIFLEVNPSGQWMWVENATGLPITDALIETLVSV